MKSYFVLILFIVLFVGSGLPARVSAQECLVFCDEAEEQAEIEEEEEEEEESESSGSRGGVVAENNSNTVIIGGDVNTTQSNTIGGIGTNSGDINQSNSANIVGQQNNSTQGNDMRSFRDRNRPRD